MMKHRINSCLVPVLALSGLLLSSAAVASTPTAGYYKVQDIGDLGGMNPAFGGLLSHNYVAGVNASGQVTGYSQTTTGGVHAFITGKDGVGIRDITPTGGGSYGWSINDSGQIAGFNGSGFITGTNGNGINIVSTTVDARPTAIDDCGRAVGEVVTDQGKATHAFITGATPHSVTMLGFPGEQSSRALAINESGQVVGDYVSAAGVSHAFITGKNAKGITDLGALGGTESHALSINSTGRVVGEYVTANNLYRAFITRANGLGMTDLGLSCGFARAMSINATAQVVGYCINGSDSYAYVTSANGVNPVNLDTLAVLPTGVHLLEAHAINDKGQITAFGSNGRMYLLTPKK